MAASTAGATFSLNLVSSGDDSNDGELIDGHEASLVRNNDHPICHTA
jgi:hypothetical protein